MGIIQDKLKEIRKERNYKKIAEKYGVLGKKHKLFVVSEEKRFDGSKDRWLVSDYEFKKDGNYSLSQKKEPDLAMDFGTVENAQKFIRTMRYYKPKTEFYFAIEQQVQQMIAEGQKKGC